LEVLKGRRKSPKKVRTKGLKKGEKCWVGAEGAH